MSKKYYVVWKGRKTGVFTNWEDCQKSVESYPGATFKGFRSFQEANEAYKQAPKTFSALKIPAASKGEKATKVVGAYIKESWCVDAACSGNPGKMEYRGVDVNSGEQLFLCGPFEDGTNNIGEFLALVHALALQYKNKVSLPIYSDSKVAMLWVKNKKAKTKLVETGRNKELFTLIERAEKWLENYSYTVPILKWETKEWGEIPADFGRK